MQRATSLDIPADTDLVDIGALVRPLWHARYALALAALLGGVSGLAIAARIQPSYRATAQVMIDPGRNDVYGEEGLIPDVTLSENLMASEVEVLSSNLVLDRVIRKLDLTSRPEFNQALSEPSPVDKAKGWVRAQLGLTAAKPAADPELAQAYLETAVYQQLLSQLDIEQNGISYVISIGASSADPQLAAQVANATAEAFIDQQIDERAAATEQATGWLDRRVQDLRAQVEAAEASIAEYKSSNLVLEGSTQEAASRQLLDLSTQVTQARARHAAASARYEQAQAASATGDLEAVAGTAVSPLINALRVQLSELERQRQQLSDLYGGSDARVSRAQVDVDNLKQQITTETKNYVDGLRDQADVSAAELKNLEESLLQQESRLLDLSKSSIELRQREREGDAVRDVYESLLARLKETHTIEQMNVADAKVVARADIPPVPASPNAALLAVLGSFAGLALASGFAVVRDLRRGRFQSPGDLEASTRLPVLAELPSIRGKSARRLTSVIRDPHSPFAERVRDLRSALQFRSGRDQRSVVMLTSAQPGEGKSTVAIALAQVASLAGKRVVLVDADLRSPSLRAVVPPSPGGDLASVLLKGTDYREALVHCKSGGFDALPTAAPNARAADSLAHPAFARLVAALRAEYDLVLIDTPPILAISDAKTIAAQADTTVLVLRLDRTPADAVARALTSLGHGRRADLFGAQPHVAGFVLTMARQDRLRSLEGYYRAAS